MGNWKTYWLLRENRITPSKENKNETVFPELTTGKSSAPSFVTFEQETIKDKAPSLHRNKDGGSLRHNPASIMKESHSQPQALPKSSKLRERKHRVGIVQENETFARTGSLPISKMRTAKENLSFRISDSNTGDTNPPLSPKTFKKVQFIKNEAINSKRDSWSNLKDEPQSGRDSGIGIDNPEWLQLKEEEMDEL